MFLVRALYRSSTSGSNVNISKQQEATKNNKNHLIIDNRDDEEDLDDEGYSHVKIRKLTYAEVASLANPPDFDASRTRIDLPVSLLEEDDYPSSSVGLDNSTLANSLSLSTEVSLQSRTTASTEGRSVLDEFQYGDLARELTNIHAPICSKKAAAGPSSSGSSRRKPHKVQRNRYSRRKVQTM